MVLLVSSFAFTIGAGEGRSHKRSSVRVVGAGRRKLSGVVLQLVGTTEVLQAALTAAPDTAQGFTQLCIGHRRARLFGMWLYEGCQGGMPRPASALPPR